MNPYLIAPRVAAYDYEVYSAPLPATRTVDGFAIDVPPDFRGRLTIAELNGTAAILPSSTNSSSSSGEEYVLRRIEIRKPGRQPPGHSQVISRDIEAVLIHEAVAASGRWLSVIVPFQSSGNHGSFLSMMDGSVLPSAVSQTTVFENPHGLDIDSALNSASFFAFWDVLPTMCAPPSARSGPDVQARILMRSSALPIEHSLFQRLDQALKNVVTPLAVDMMASTWTMASCSVTSSCSNVQVPATASHSALSEAQTLLSQAVAEVRQREDLMNTAKANMDACAAFMRQFPTLHHTCRDGNFSAYSSALDDLHSASDEMEQLTTKVNDLRTQITSANNTHWDADAPPLSSASSTSTATPSAALLISAGGYVVSEGEASMAFTDLSGAEDCSVLQRSPVDISTALSRHPTAVVGDSLKPVMFTHMDRAMGSVEAHAVQTRLRITPSLPAQLSGKSLLNLGAMVVDGSQKAISYIDIYTPGQHALDGSVSAAEVHLVHEPSHIEDSTVTVAVRLGVGVEDTANAWLESLMNSSAMSTARWHDGSAVQAEAVAGLGQLHAALQAGTLEKFYSYSGTSTAPPCRPTRWFVVEDAGFLSRRQLSALKSMTSRPKKRALFKARGVSIGPGTVKGHVGHEHLLRRGAGKPTLRGGLEAPSVMEVRAVEQHQLGEEAPRTRQSGA
eukprot:CAMPEP_0178407676 /NCGR_PEP_ID=MMETSP0689_2-20121128/19549_1 /TAXON_ID=160604 /ORGANISM="Amphidinium massartii, Strain CS-259" /LENGTH=674 /DNA_ID=CAMNT_0020028753 /DNA_START=218 /DNA_END=2237 /DNA_ORIENTATION=+